MSNVRGAPAWLNAAVAGQLAGALDQVAATNTLRALGLTGREIVALERVAAVKAMSAEACAGELIRAALAAIAAGGWDADAI